LRRVCAGSITSSTTPSATARLAGRLDESDTELLTRAYHLYRQLDVPEAAGLAARLGLPS
jgi:hypothetical protein